MLAVFSEYTYIRFLVGYCCFIVLGLEKMYALEELDLSNNNLETVLFHFLF